VQMDLEGAGGQAAVVKSGPRAAQPQMPHLSQGRANTCDASATMIAGASVMQPSQTGHPPQSVPGMMPAGGIDSLAARSHFPLDHSSRTAPFSLSSAKQLSPLRMLHTCS
jgi:hypothetical protein